MANDFLIQLDAERNFYTKTVDGQVYGTPYPSSAAHMNYQAADVLCQQLRKQGYRAAVVVNQFGQPVTATDLDSAKQPFAPPADWPHTLREFAIMGIPRRLRMNPEFLEYIETLK